MSFVKKLKSLVASKKGSAGDISKSVKSLVVAALVLGGGLIGLVAFQDANSTSAAANTTIGQFVTGLGQFGNWVGIIVIMIAIGIMLYYVNKFSNKGQ